MAARVSGKSGSGRSRSATRGSSTGSAKAQAQARALAALTARLDHRFSRPGLLAEALTHASVEGRPSNERLEFLGDRVLGLVIAEILHARYPDASEGELALRLNALVRRETCAEVARATGIAEALCMGGAGSGAEGQNPAALADACEAVIAALYLDGGLAAARAFVTGAWADHLARLSPDMRDAKTMLQEWSQGAAGGARGMPSYAIVGREGPDHAPVFTVSVRLPGLPEMQASGRSRREAEQAAARRMLAAVGLIPETAP